MLPADLQLPPDLPLRFVLLSLMATVCALVFVDLVEAWGERGRRG